MLEKLYNRTRSTEKALDAAWLRNEVISQNIANADTPGYKKKTVAFEEYLNQAMDSSTLKGFRSDKKHFPIGKDRIDEVDPVVKEDSSSLSMRLDGNNVDIDTEMADLAKNTIKYNTLIQNLNSQFKRIKSVINEGRK